MGITFLTDSPRLVYVARTALLLEPRYQIASHVSNNVSWRLACRRHCNSQPAALAIAMGYGIFVGGARHLRRCRTTMARQRTLLGVRSQHSRLNDVTSHSTYHSMNPQWSAALRAVEEIQMQLCGDNLSVNVETIALQNQKINDLASGKSNVDRKACMPQEWELALQIVETFAGSQARQVQHVTRDVAVEPVPPELSNKSFDSHVADQNAEVPISERKYVPSVSADALTCPDGRTRKFLYDPSGKPMEGAPIVHCHNWDNMDLGSQRSLADMAMSQLVDKGYVVLECLLPADRLQALDDEFREYKQNSPSGVTFSRMRASRNMTIPPFAGVWTEDWLVCHPLVLSLISRYLRNSTDMSDEKAAELGFAHWIAAGSNINDFLTGEFSAGFPVLDLMVVVDTPPGAEAQTRHRDTILPGPCASIGVHIPLTCLQAEPLNGSIGFSPSSQTLRADDTVDVVGAVPQGSVILYDSFTEHHGLENKSDRPRAALFSWYRVPGVYSGHTQENFGDQGLRLTDQFRQHVNARLHSIDMEEPHLGAEEWKPSQEAIDRWGFQKLRPVVPWGLETVCFQCDTTTSMGAPPQAPVLGGRPGEWYCAACWEKAARTNVAPIPTAANMAPPSDEQGLFTEEQLVELAAQGLNIKPSAGRHKLTLLRERGLYLPVDPSSSWLARISNDPQPSGWKDALRKALGEIPRLDGF